MQYQETQMQSFTYKSKKSIRSTLAIGLFALGACASQSVLAADWPAKPVKVIVAFTAGGTTDILARAVSHGLTQKWGQSVVVENRPGAGGNIGKIGRAHVRTQVPNAHL